MTSPFANKNKLTLMTPEIYQELYNQLVSSPSAITTIFRRSMLHVVALGENINYF